MILFLWGTKGLGLVPPRPKSGRRILAMEKRREAEWEAAATAAAAAVAEFEPEACELLSPP